MSEPHRVQLSRKKGWHMPPNTVKVDRSTKWGNPFRITARVSREESMEKFEHWIASTPEGRDLAKAAKEELRGKNLACWCHLDEACHADILLRVSNQGSA